MIDKGLAQKNASDLYLNKWYVSKKNSIFLAFSALRGYSTG